MRSRLSDRCDQFACGQFCDDVTRAYEHAGLDLDGGDKGLAGGTKDAPAPYVAACHLLCDSVEAYQSSFEPYAQEISGDIRNFTDQTPIRGRGKHSRRTPDELVNLGHRLGIDGENPTRSGRLAKVDSAAVQDGFELYLHGFFVTSDGKWTVVQQGMHGDRRQARRYHWHSAALRISSPSRIARSTDRSRARSSI